MAEAVAPGRLTLTDAEAAFLAATADTLIPEDSLSPSASACGVIDFIDRELAGDWGNGARLYRDGPIVKGKPEHGYQLGLTPRDFFRAGIAAAERWTESTYGKSLAALSEADREAALSAMDSGKAVFADFESREFFEALLAIVMEGFFADPIHGGNRGMAGWKMVGYPGQPANYRDVIEQQRGKRYDAAPRSIKDIS
jgi:gluconate 2-dehydrogenase gamma chain